MSENTASAASAGASTAATAGLRAIMSHVISGAAWVVNEMHRLEQDWLSFRKDDPSLAGLVTEGALVAESRLVARGIDIPAGINLAEEVGKAVEAMVAHVDNVAPVPPPASAASAPSGAGRLASAALISLILAGSMALSGCNADGTLNPQGAKIIGAVCKIDQATQPVLVAMAPTLLPQAGPLAEIDNAGVHPAVVQACAAIGGQPLAAQVQTNAPAMPVAIVPVQSATAPSAKP